jgi:hypothetical protein
MKLMNFGKHGYRIPVSEDRAQPPRVRPLLRLTSLPDHLILSDINNIPFSTTPAPQDSRLPCSQRGSALFQRRAGLAGW